MSKHHVLKSIQMTKCLIVIKILRWISQLSILSPRTLKSRKSNLKASIDLLHTQTVLILLSCHSIPSCYMTHLGTSSLFSQDDESYLAVTGVVTLYLPHHSCVNQCRVKIYHGSCIFRSRTLSAFINDLYVLEFIHVRILSTGTTLLCSGSDDFLAVRSRPRYMCDHWTRHHAHAWMHVNATKCTFSGILTMTFSHSQGWHYRRNQIITRKDV